MYRGSAFQCAFLDTIFAWNKRTACEYQRSAVGRLIENKKPKLEKGHNTEKMHSKLSPLIVWIALWIMNSYSRVSSKYLQ